MTTAKAICDYRGSLNRKLDVSDLEEIPNVPRSKLLDLLRRGDITLEADSFSQETPNKSSNKSPTTNSDISDLMTITSKMNENMLTVMQQFGHSMSSMNKTLQQLVDSKTSQNINQNNANSTSARPTTTVHTLPGGLSADFYEVHAPGGVYNVASDMTQELSSTRNIPTSTALMTVNQGRHAVNDHFYGPSSKMMTFDGKVNWKAFRLQFEEMAVTYHWTEEVKLRNLLSVFTTKRSFFILGSEKQFEETLSSFEIAWRGISEDGNHPPQYAEGYRTSNKWLMSRSKILPTKATT